ncbi:MAG: hybrid sensor histidine kinase/response regulator, partial [Zoogloeaceae bacterium]|nr:hybrid sensor histidine kinase/response regulator [Zoogloeaceae bacterium]
MSAVMENQGFDIGPLSWVKREIDIALEEAQKALEQYRAGRESTNLKFARTHLQQAHGALVMIGIDGVTQVSEALDTLLAQVENNEVPIPDTAITVVEQGFLALRQYLDDLLAGEAHQSLRLLPTYQSIARAQGKIAVNPVDLFFPDLSRRPPKRTVQKLSPEERKKIIHSERTLFQKGLLTWLRAKDENLAREGLAKMRIALHRIEATQTSPSVRAFWWAALGLVTALLHGGTQIGDARSLCARIDQQIRRLLQGNPGIAERLLRDCLYYVARMPESADPLLQEIQRVYHLKSLVPTPESATRHASTAQIAALRPLKEMIATASEQWNRFCAGSATSLAVFAEQVKGATRHAAAIDADVKTLIDALAATSAWLSADAARQTDTLAMEIATALILIQFALEGYPHLGADFPAQAALMAKRLDACRAGQTLADSDAPILDEMTRRAQEKMLMAQVAREIQTNLGEVEQALDAFFRDNSKRPQAAELESLLNQIAGALAILGQDEAAAYLKASEAKVLAFAQPDYAVDNVACETVARELSTLSFFIDTLASGEIRFADFLRRFEEPSAAPVQKEEEDEEEESTTAAGSVEAQLESLKAETRQLLAALQANPEDAALRAKLAERLENLQKDADLVADTELLSQARSALAALKQKPEKTQQVEAMAAVAEALAPINAPPLPVAEPSAETLHLVEADKEELDAELLEIFL